MADPNSSSSSDFVCEPKPKEAQHKTDSMTGSQAIQVSRGGHPTLVHTADKRQGCWRTRPTNRLCDGAMKGTVLWSWRFVTAI